MRCGVDGCRETGNYEYSTQREYAEHSKRLVDRPYRCYRHSAPDEVLSETNRDRVTVLTVEERDNIKGKRFWNGTGGLVSGPGFRAIAEDWPVGTQLVVTVSVLTKSVGAGASVASPRHDIGPQ